MPPYSMCRLPFLFVEQPRSGILWHTVEPIARTGAVDDGAAGCCVGGSSKCLREPSKRGVSRMLSHYRVLPQRFPETETKTAALD